MLAIQVKALAASIAQIGLLEPIDVLEVDGKFYGFSGCHRYEARPELRLETNRACASCMPLVPPQAHQQLGLETIRCRVLKSNRETLQMHIS